MTSHTRPGEWKDAKAVDEEVGEMLRSGLPLYHVDEEKIRELEPVHLILTQDICNVCAVDLSIVQRLAEKLMPQPHVVSLNPQVIRVSFDV